MVAKMGALRAKVESARGFGFVVNEANILGNCGMGVCFEQLAVIPNRWT